MYMPAIWLSYAIAVNFVHELTDRCPKDGKIVAVCIGYETREGVRDSVVATWPPLSICLPLRPPVCTLANGKAL
jgi:hypothetical protein